MCTSIGTPGGCQSEWVADLFEIRTSAVKRAMKVLEVIVRVIDGLVK
jgi:hypothetical protein